MKKKPDRIVQIEGDASRAFKAAMLQAIGKQVDALYPAIKAATTKRKRRKPRATK